MIRSTPNNLKTRPYQTGDEIGMALLFLKIFKIAKSPQEIISIWNWKYKNSPYGFKAILAENASKQIVGHFGTWTVKWLFKNETIFINQLADIILEKKYRGQKFVYNCMANLINSNIYVYGFLNNFLLRRLRNETFTNKININFKINILRKKINWLNFKFKKYHLTDIIIEKIYDPKETIEKLWLEKKSEIIASAVRDWKFIKWRILSSPEKNNLLFIRKESIIIGYIAIKIAKKVCVIQDILIINQYINPDIILTIEKYCYDNFGIRKIKIMINNKILYDLFTSQSYKVTQTRNFMFISNQQLMLSDFYLTLIDTDFYDF